MDDALDSRPLFSIITVCFNALTSLQRTVESVCRQTATDYEHIIIDGASKDGTRDWLDNLTLPRVQWRSEPDNGLYDAMNKGIMLSRGKYVWFINAGDLIADENILSHLMALAKHDPDILYGEVLLFDQTGRVIGTRSDMTTRSLPKYLDWTDMKFGMVVSHQAFLPKRDIAPEYIEGNLCADIDWVIRCLKMAKTVKNTEMVLAHFETGGISTLRHRTSLKDRYIVLQKHFGIVPNFLNHLFICWRAIHAHFK